VGTLLVLLAAYSGYRYWRSFGDSRARLAGYVSDVQVLRDEYQRFYGKPFAYADAERQFLRAGELMMQRDMGGAVGMLEGVVAGAAVPVVYNDLGVLYAAMSDRARCVNAFREALSRDASYRPVRENLNRLRTFLADSADPVSMEIENNGSLRDANPIALGTAVNAAIGSVRDGDYFRFTTPPPPRDVLTIEVLPATTLVATIRFYDADQRPLAGQRASASNGEPLRYTITPTPNTTLYVQVSGARDSVGAYSLQIAPTRSYDAFEPDDDIFSAHRLTFDTPVEAGLMDGEDTDYFQFTANRDGQVEVTIRNGSNTLVPALTVYDSSRRNIGFGPDVTTPGADLRHTFAVVNGQTYYLQVWSQPSMPGKYSLTIH
jgi:hypothetical protein